jgi:hypothetical protein
LLLLAPSGRKEAQEPQLDRRVMDRLRETGAMLEAVGPNQRNRVGQPEDQSGIEHAQHKRG